MTFALGFADSVATPPRRTGIETGADKRNKALTLLGLAENVQTQKSPDKSGRVSQSFHVRRLTDGAQRFLTATLKTDSLSHGFP